MVDEINMYVDIFYLAYMGTEIYKILCYKGLNRTRITLHYAVSTITIQTNLK